MADNAVPTLVPKEDIDDVLGSLTPPAVSSVLSEKKALFESIAHEDANSESNEESSNLKTFFAGLLWFGYAVSIVVALVLVWSAANGLVKSLPH